MNLHHDEIHVYHSLPANNTADANSYHDILSGDELDRANRFIFEKDKNNYVKCRGVIRNILSNYLNIPPGEIIFSYEEKGKPYIKGSRIKFNIAHSNGFGVYAVTADDEVGIDVEFKREMSDAVRIAERYFSSDEIERFKEDHNDMQNSFFNCWTRKEAFIKAIGEGLSYPLKDFSVTLLQQEEPGILWIKKNPDEIKEWTLYNVDLDKQYTVSVAIKSKDKKIVIKK